MNTSDYLTEEGGTMPPHETPPTDIPSSAPSNALSGPNWHEQDETLRVMWMRKCAPQEISDALGRSIPAIMTRAARLGLPRRSAPGRKPGQQKSSESQGSASARAAARARAESATGIHSETEHATKYSERICLMCLSRFQSAGRHNRICPSCRNSSEYASASALPDIQYSTL
ncbi:MAG: hypothetical protein ABTQ34_00115 [Bdellovibrionales bacterium]